MKFQFSKAAYAAAQVAREAAIVGTYGKIAEAIAKATTDSLQQSAVAVSLASDAVAKRDTATQALWTGCGQFLDQLRTDCEGKSPQEAAVVVESAMAYLASKTPEAPKGSTPAQYLSRVNNMAKAFPLGEYWTATLKTSDKTAEFAEKPAVEISYKQATEALRVLKAAEKDKDIVMLENMAGTLADAIKLAIRGKAAKKAKDDKPEQAAVKAVKAEVLHKYLTEATANIRELLRVAQLAIADMDTSEGEDLEEATRPDVQAVDVPRAANG